MSEPTNAVAAPMLPGMNGQTAHVGNADCAEARSEAGVLNSWLSTAQEQLESLRSYQDDWDGYDADAPRSEALEAAQGFLVALADGSSVGPPYVLPTRSGGVVFTWEKGPLHLEIDIDGPRETSFVYLDKTTEESKAGTVDLRNPLEGTFGSLLSLFILP